MASEGPNSPSTATEQEGGASWTNPNNVLASDNAYGVIVWDGDVGAKTVAVTNFGFSIPAGATIDGILVEIEWKVASGTIAPYVGITKNGTSSIAGITSPSITTTEQYLSYGGAANLWSITWTPAEVNASTFGVRLQRGDDGTVSVDHVRVTVYFTGGGVPFRRSLLGVGF